MLESFISVIRSQRHQIFAVHVTILRYDLKSILGLIILDGISCFVIKGFVVKGYVDTCTKEITEAITGRGKKLRRQGSWLRLALVGFGLGFEFGFGFGLVQFSGSA